MIHSVPAVSPYLVQITETSRFSGAPGEMDLNYINALLDDMLASFPIDPQRLYLIGFSNGGMFVSDILLDGRLNARFAAACNYMGGIGVEQVRSLFDQRAFNQVLLCWFQLEDFGLKLDDVIEETRRLS